MIEKNKKQTNKENKSIAVAEQQKPLYFLGRAQEGPYLLFPNELNQIVSGIVPHLKLGKVLLITFEDEEELAVLQLLVFLANTLKKEGHQVKFISPLDCPYIGKWLIYPTFIVLRAFSYADFYDFVYSLEQDQFLIATALTKELSLSVLPFTYKAFSFSEKLRGMFELERIESNKDCLLAQERKKFNKEIEEAYYLVAVFDSVGFPLPLSIFSRFFGEEWQLVLNKTEGLIHRMEYTESVFLTTKGSWLARELVKSLSEDRILDFYIRAVQMIDILDKDERYLVIKLFQCLLSQNRKRWAKRIAENNREKINELWIKGDSFEKLAWGKFFEELNMFELSAGVFKSALDVESNNIYLLHAYARMLGKWRKYDDSRSIFQRAADRAPKNVYVLQSWGEMEVRRGNFNEAKRRFREVLDCRPENIYTLISFADFWVAQGEYVEAKRLLTQAKNLNEKIPYIYHILGRLEQRQGNFKKAEEYFGKVLMLDERNPVALNAFGVLSWKRGHWKEAEEWLCKALEVDSENLHSLNALGNLKVEEEKYDEAKELFEKVIYLDPYNVKTFVSLALLESKQACFDAANNYLEEAQSIESSPHVYSAWGEVKQCQGDVALARWFFEESIRSAEKLAKQNLPVRNTFAKFLLEQKDFNTLERVWSEIFEILETQSEKIDVFERIITHNTWAKIQIEAENFKKAEELYKESLKLDPDNAYTLKAFAEMLKKAGKDEEAQKYFQRAKEFGMG